MTLSQLSRIGQRYVDYDEEKTLIKQEHVIKNYDGGQSFYKAHDEHLRRKQYEAKLTNQTLQSQLQHKEQIKLNEKEKKNEENQAFLDLKYQQSLVNE